MLDDCNGASATVNRRVGSAVVRASNTPPLELHSHHNPSVASFCFFSYDILQFDTRTLPACSLYLLVHPYLSDGRQPSYRVHCEGKPASNLTQQCSRPCEGLSALGYRSSSGCKESKAHRTRSEMRQSAAVPAEPVWSMCSGLGHLFFGGRWVQTAERIERFSACEKMARNFNGKLIRQWLHCRTGYKVYPPATVFSLYT